ncbi:hypothetical protein QIS74_10553 [Colletotrichum tabaci]|uniref:Uncharacterized protein n=1 Tax=Colletotrichum tabaci TaxID=1209068 RepID=A0AAV9T0X0_9PEZI
MARRNLKDRLHLLRKQVEELEEELLSCPVPQNGSVQQNNLTCRGTLSRRGPSPAE